MFDKRTFNKVESSHGDILMYRPLLCFLFVYLFIDKIFTKIFLHMFFFQIEEVHG
jgi:hypothetical protein